MKLAGSSLTICPVCGALFPTDAAIVGGALNNADNMAATTSMMSAETLRTTVHPVDTKND